MCCFTHSLDFPGSVAAEHEGFRCRCACGRCPRRADGEDLLCPVCRTGGWDPAYGRPAALEGYVDGSMRFGDYRRLLREAGPPGYQPFEMDLPSWEPLELTASEPLDWSPEPAESLRLSPGAQERVARMMREAGGKSLPEGSFPVVNGVARPRRWEQAGPLRLDPSAFTAGNFSVSGGLPLA